MKRILAVLCLCLLPPTAPARAAENLAIGRPAAQSSTYRADGPAANAVDGRTDGNYFDGSVTHTGKDPNAWWEVDLGAVRSLQSVIVFNRTDQAADRLTDFYVLVSSKPFGSRSLDQLLEDKSIWRRRHTGTVNGSVTINAKAQGRYVRIQLAGANFLSLAEVQVMGDAAAGSSPDGGGYYARTAAFLDLVLAAKYDRALAQTDGNLKKTDLVAFRQLLQKRGGRVTSRQCVALGDSLVDVMILLRNSEGGRTQVECLFKSGRIHALAGK